MIRVHICVCIICVGWRGGAGSQRLFRCRCSVLTRFLQRLWVCYVPVPTHLSQQLFTANGLFKRLWSAAFHVPTDALQVWENLVIGGASGVLSATAICAPEVRPVRGTTPACLCIRALDVDARKSPAIDFPLL